MFWRGKPVSFWDDKDATSPVRLLNVGAVETWDALWWVGDRADIDAMVAAGFRQTVALAGRVDYALKQHANDLKTLGQIVLCLPSTPAGRKLQEVLAAPSRQASLLDRSVAAWMLQRLFDGNSTRI
jgi:hypothetical protein